MYLLPQKLYYTYFSCVSEAISLGNYSETVSSVYGCLLETSYKILYILYSNRYKICLQTGKHCFLYQVAVRGAILPKEDCLAKIASPNANWY